MPLYEFECGKCHNRLERIQKFSDPNPETCPKCGGGPMEKLPASPAIQFKGSGWYITDYAKKSSSDAGKSGSSDKSSDKGDASKSSGESGGSDGGKSSKDSASTTTPTAKPE